MLRSALKPTFSIALLLLLLLSLLIEDANTELLAAVTCLAGVLLFGLMYVDARFFGFSWASISLLTLVYPAFVAVALGPSGDLLPAYDSHTHIVRAHLRTAVVGIIYFYVVFSWLLYRAGWNFRQFDIRSMATLQLPLNWGRLSALAAILLTYLSHPGVPKAFTGTLYGAFEGIDRASAGVWGAGGSITAVLAGSLSFAAPKSFFRFVALLFVPLWLLLNWARVEPFGLLLFYALWSFGKGVRIKRWVVPTVVVLACLLLVLSTVVGSARSGGEVTYSSVVGGIVQDVLGNGTAQGGLYAGIVCIDISTGGSRASRNWSPRDLLPGVLGGTSQGFSGDIQLDGLTQGGVYAPFEAFVAGGPLAFLVSPFIMFYFISILRLFYGKIFGPTAYGIFYSILILTSLRMPWYGFRYLSTPLILLIPIVCLLVNFGPAWCQKVGRTYASRRAEAS